MANNIKKASLNWQTYQTQHQGKSLSNKNKMNK